jgi:hypothetical protein
MIFLTSFADIPKTASPMSDAAMLLAAGQAWYTSNPPFVQTRTIKINPPPIDPEARGVTRQRIIFIPTDSEELTVLEGEMPKCFVPVKKMFIGPEFFAQMRHTGMRGPAGGPDGPYSRQGSSKRAKVTVVGPTNTEDVVMEVTPSCGDDVDESQEVIINDDNRTHDNAEESCIGQEARESGQREDDIQDTEQLTSEQRQLTADQADCLSRRTIMKVNFQAMHVDQASLCPATSTSTITTNNRRPPTLNLPPPPQPLPGMISTSPEALSETMAAPVRRTPSNRLRAWKIRRARDEFLTRGPSSPFSHYSRQQLPPSSPEDQIDHEALEALYRDTSLKVGSCRRRPRPVQPTIPENR